MLADDWLPLSPFFQEVTTEHEKRLWYEKEAADPLRKAIEQRRFDDSGAHHT